MEDKRSIGVFDSGVGGLTVVKELKKVMPNEDIIYFGDTARLPYGTRGKDIILYYAKQDINFMISQNVKAIIVACGTASTVITDEVRQSYDLPIFTVIDPACFAACNSSVSKKIGIIATAATVNSKAHDISIKKFDKNTSVFSVACPLLVSLVENGYIDYDNKVTRLVLEDYLSTLKQQDIDTLILGCTHYPIIADIIGSIMGNQVKLINNGEQTAKHVAYKLKYWELLNSPKRHGNCKYFVSDNPQSFSNIANIFLSDNTKVIAKKIDINKY